MNVQLLLLLALAGPFCAFTHASPTEIPAELATGIPERIEHVTAAETEAAEEEVTVVTGPPATEPAAASAEVTEAVHVDVTEAAAEAVTEAAAEAAAEAVTEAAAEAATEAVTEAAAEAEFEETTELLHFIAITEEPILETEAPTAAAEAVEPLATEAPAVETAAPTEAAEDAPVATVAAELEKEEDVVVVDEPEEGMSSGQVAGTVIGSLLAVVFVIAVMTFACRRMGKYSSPRNKKPQKKDNTVKSPLKKKTAKQQEQPRFWKF